MSKKRFQAPVEFGNVNIGDETAALPIKISKACMSADRAEETLCGRRCEVTIELGNFDSAAEQQHFEGIESITATVDIRGYTSRPKAIGCGLTFSLAEIELKDLAAFARGKGRITIDSVVDIPPKERKSGESEEPDANQMGLDLGDDDAQPAAATNGKPEGWQAGAKDIGKRIRARAAGAPGAAKRARKKAK